MNIKTTSKSHLNLLPYSRNEYKGFIRPSLIPWIDSNGLEKLLDKNSAAEIIKEKPNLIFRIKVRDLKPFSDIVVKKFYHRNFLQFIMSPLKKSKSVRSFTAAKHLLANGLDTPLPLCVIDRRRFGFIKESYYITEYIGKNQKVKHCLLENPINEDKVLKLIDLVADYCKSMHGSGMIHRDLNLANFLITKNRLVLVDLNRSRIRKSIGYFSRVKDIGRLYWRRYRSHFFQIYAENEKRLYNWKWYFDLYYIWRKKRRRFKDWLKNI